jgi:hypothetical protein
MHDLILFMYSLRSRGLSADPASRIARGCGSSADPKLADPDYPRIQIFWIRTSLLSMLIKLKVDSTETLAFLR